MLIEKIDSFILGLCTKFAHFVQRLTGKTNYFIAKIGIIIATFHTIMDIVNYFNQFLLFKTTLIGMIISPIFTTYAFFDCVNLEKAEKMVESEERTKPIIARRGTPLYRMFFVFSTCFDICGSISLVNKSYLTAIVIPMFSFGIAVFYYFIEVDPLKPGKSKIQQWVESLCSFFAKPAIAEN